MDTLTVASWIAESGLVVHEFPEEDRVMITRPASLEGTKFRGWQNNRVISTGETIILVNAPLATLKEIRTGKRKKYNLDISLSPGPIWINEDFKDIKDAVKAAIECYLGDRIDFNNESLNEWYPQSTN